MQRLFEKFNTKLLTSLILLSLLAGSVAAGVKITDAGISSNGDKLYLGLDGGEMKANLSLGGYNINNVDSLMASSKNITLLGDIVIDGNLDMNPRSNITIPGGKISNFKYNTPIRFYHDENDNSGETAYEFYSGVSKSTANRSKAKIVIEENGDLDLVGNEIRNGKFKGNLSVADTRDLNRTPNSTDRIVRFDFKDRGTVGVPGSGRYSGMMTFAPWKDSSGDLSHQINFNNAGLYWRKGNPDKAAWKTWRRIFAGDGNGNLDMRTNDINDVGTLNANTKNFVQSVNKTHEAVYTSQESPMPRAVIEGTEKIENGSATVDLPLHFEQVVSDKEPKLNVQVTSLGEKGMPVRVLEKSQQGFTVEQSVGEPESFNIDYRVSGIREGHEQKVVVRKKN